ncbi:hypothetical protein CDES_08610 [Corynebacterium deserti GIMN1.010]|uniref:Integral membrane protein n=1 Tax=Corynebacterium deserti GIMN1.010 TaxID=931089 RepID=A0A0M4CJU5_9CORY|nr:hypothetical protein [Corynebacterium deserti]ALC06114.1 hypothetical protein CDES_08610 [Corynebacterium deserti GIMN1.010]
MSRDDQTNNGGDGSTNNAGNQNAGNQNWGDPNSLYGPTSHPEDAPGGFQANAANGQSWQSWQSSQYPQQPYPGSNAYQGYQGFQQGYSDALPLEAGTGRVDLMRAVRFGFRTTFSNPVVWILGTVMLGIAVVFFSGLSGYLSYILDPEAATSGQVSVTSVVINVLAGIVMLAVSICVIRGTLTAVDGHKTRYSDFFHPQNVGQTAILMVILAIVGSIVGTIASTLTLDMFIIDETLEAVDVNSSVLGIMAVYLLVLFLISPLYSYWVYYTSDGHHSAASAVKTGFRDALRNYPVLLLFTLVGGVVVSFVGFVTLFFGFVILLPAFSLASAHIYRQMSGGNIPVEQRR